MLHQYTEKRADELKKMHIPETELPLSVKTLWLDGMNAEEIARFHYSGVHAHSFCEIQFVFSGTVTYECDGREQRISAGQALFLPPDVPHQFVCCSRDAVKVSLAVAFAIFEGREAQVFAFSKELAERMDYILMQSGQKDVLTPGIISGRILEMVFMVCESLKIELPQHREGDLDPRFLVAKDYIENNHNRTISCEDVAMECCLSSKQISRIFKIYTGSSLFEYIVKERMKYAKELLLHSEASIKEISFTMGFENECSFISFFKRHSGMPPGIYRKEKRRSSK